MENWKLLAGALVVIVGVSFWYANMQPVDHVLEAAQKATQKCMAESRLDSLCMALGANNPALCDQDLSPEDCHVTFKIAKVLEGSGSCGGIEDPAYAAVCQAIAQKDDSVCEDGGEDELQCKALVNEDAKYCETYQDPALRELCTGRVYWQRAIKSGNESLCAKISDLSDVMACDVMVTKNPAVCPTIKQATCRAIAQQEQGLHTE